MRKFLILFILVIASMSFFGWLELHDIICFCNGAIIDGTIDDTLKITETNIVLDGKTHTAEQWIMEYRVDSIYVTQMDAGDGRSVDLTTATNEGTENDVLKLTLSANGEYWWYDLDEITADSARLDSINWQMSIVATNADTVLLGYIDPMGGTCPQASFVTTDTIITASNRLCMDTTVVFSQLINKSNKRYFPYINLYETSSSLRLHRLILYYKAYNKRYGIPE